MGAGHSSGGCGCCSGGGGVYGPGGCCAVPIGSDTCPNNIDDITVSVVWQCIPVSNGGTGGTVTISGVMVWGPYHSQGPLVFGHPFLNATGFASPWQALPACLVADGSPDGFIRYVGTCPTIYQISGNDEGTDTASAFPGGGALPDTATEDDCFPCTTVTCSCDPFLLVWNSTACVDYSGGIEFPYLSGGCVGIASGVISQ